MVRHTGFVAVLDNIRSLHNVGAIFRTADGAGVDQLYLCGITATPPRPEIRKAALGAEEFVQWEHAASTSQVLAQLRDQGYQLVALETGPGSVNFKRAALRLPLALVIGNEYHGMPADILKTCDQLISIPMFGRKDSLNVAVAFGIVAYEIALRRNVAT